MYSNTRRRRPNYLLPSECWNVFRQMIGKPIVDLKFATRDVSVPVNISSAAPCFLAAEPGCCIAMYDDDFLESIVIRVVDEDINNPLLLNKLEHDDQVGARMQPRFLHKAGKSTWRGKLISEISIYKLPTNYYSKPIGYNAINECVIEFALSGGEKFIFASHIQGGGYADLRISSWDRLDQASVADLSCILRVPTY